MELLRKTVRQVQLINRRCKRSLPRVEIISCRANQSLIEQKYQSGGFIEAVAARLAFVLAIKEPKTKREFQS